MAGTAISAPLDYARLAEKSQPSPNPFGLATPGLLPMSEYDIFVIFGTLSGAAGMAKFLGIETSLALARPAAP